MGIKGHTVRTASMPSRSLLACRDREKEEKTRESLLWKNPCSGVVVAGKTSGRRSSRPLARQRLPFLAGMLLSAIILPSIWRHASGNVPPPEISPWRKSLWFAVERMTKQQPFQTLIGLYSVKKSLSRAFGKKPWWFITT